MVPMSTKDKGIASHVQVNPPEGGVKMPCFIRCEAIRSISKDRLLDRWGTVNGSTLQAVENIIRTLLGLP